VAEKLTDGAERRTAHHEPRRERMAKIVPPEVVDSRVLDRRVEPLLEVLNRFTSMGALRVREHADTLSVRSPKSLESSVSGRSEWHGVRFPALAAGNPDDTIQPVHPVPLETEQVATTETGVNRQFDRLAQERGTGDLAGLDE